MRPRRAHPQPAHERGRPGAPAEPVHAVPAERPAARVPDARLPRKFLWRRGWRRQERRAAHGRAPVRARPRLPGADPPAHLQAALQGRRADPALTGVAREHRCALERGAQDVDVPERRHARVRARRDGGREVRLPGRRLPVRRPGRAHTVRGVDARLHRLQPRPSANEHEGARRPDPDPCDRQPGRNRARLGQAALHRPGDA